MTPLILPAGEYAVTEPVWLSKCCGKPARAEGRVSRFWRCTGCKNPCDAVPAEREAINYTVTSAGDGA